MISTTGVALSWLLQFSESNLFIVSGQLVFCHITKGLTTAPSDYNAVRGDLNCAMLGSVSHCERAWLTLRWGTVHWNPFGAACAASSNDQDLVFVDRAAEVGPSCPSGSFTLHVQLGLGWDVFQNGWDGSQQLRRFVPPPPHHHH